MPKFELACAVTVSAYTVVEAASLDEAKLIAKNRSVEIGCRGGEDANETWVIDDADGAPTDVHEA